MFVGSFEVEAPGTAVRFSVDGSGWCSLSLKTGGQTVPLGAEMLVAVVARLQRGLADRLDGAPISELSGAPAWWVLSLAEAHCALYVVDEPSGRRLLFQDRDGKKFHEVTLSGADRVRWTEALERALRSAQPVALP